MTLSMFLILSFTKNARNWPRSPSEMIQAMGGSIPETSLNDCWSIKGGRTAFEDPESPAAIRAAESEIYHRGYLVFIVRGRNKSKNRSSLTSEEGAEGKQKNGEEKLFCPLYGL